MIYYVQLLRYGNFLLMCSAYVGIMHTYSMRQKLDSTVVSLCVATCACVSIYVQITRAEFISIPSSYTCNVSGLDELLILTGICAINNASQCAVICH